MKTAITRPMIRTFLTAVLLQASASALADGALMIKTGNVELWDATQNLDAVDRTFDNNSWRTFAIAWEHRNRRGMGMGMEYITYRHDYTPGTGIGAGQAKTQILMFSAKKYFNPSSVVHPFIGIGIGLGHTSVTGGADLSPDLNIEMQLAGGLELRFDNIGIYMEAKGLYNDNDGPAHNRYDPSATGVFGGISFIF
jgi:hypothetical protein